MHLFHLFKSFAPKPSALLGFTIDQTTIRLVELHKAKNNYWVNICIQEKLPSPEFPLTHPNFPDFLKNTIAAAKITTRKVILALPYSSVIFKTIELDKKLNEHEIAIQVKEHVQQYFNYPISELLMDFELLGSSKKHPNLHEIRWVAARKSEVATLITAIEKSGLTVAAVEVDSFTVQRVAQFYVDEKHPNVKNFIAIQVYSSHILCVAVSKNHIVYMREENSVTDMYSAICKVLNLFVNSESDVVWSLMMFSGSILSPNLLANVKNQFDIATAYLDILPLLQYNSNEMVSCEFAMNVGLAMRVVK